MDIVLARFFLAFALGCTSSCQNTEASRAYSIPLKATLPDLPAGSDVGRAAFLGYSHERSLGASCPNDDVQRNQVSGLISGACIGRSPPEFAKILMAIPEESSGWPLEQRTQWLKENHPLIAIPGFGTEPDMLVGDESLWIRSFHGFDESTITYLVQLPSGQSGEARCEVMLNGLRAYEVRRGERPQELPGSPVPLPAAMTSIERKRYGPHIGSNVTEACDADVDMDLTRLQFVPVIRWSITDFDPDMPLADSDPRVFGDWGHAHFGFIVWNGKSFDLHERIPHALWPCVHLGQGRGHCALSPSEKLDRFVTDADQ